VPRLDGANTFSGATTVFNGNVGIGMVPGGSSIVDIGKNQNNSTHVWLHNTDPGVNNVSQYLTGNGSTNGALAHFGLNYNPSVPFRADGTAVYTPGVGGLTLATTAAQPIYIATNNTERMRITPTGFFKADPNGTYYQIASDFHEINSPIGSAPTLTIRNTHAAQPYGHDVLFSGAAPNNATNWFWRATDSGSGRAYIYSNGGLANYSANNVNLSDALVKGAVEPYDEKQLDALQASFLQVNWGRFKYLDQTHTDWNHGYTAQGIEAAFALTAPELVDETDIGPHREEGEPKRKGVYDADLTHIGLALLSRALKRIADLESRLAKAGLS
jgi:hypothetical protein